MEKKFLNTQDTLYKDIELVMQIITAASVAISVESVVESIVSTYENRQSKVRTLPEDRANNEMLIGVNGPNLTSADNLLKRALDKYFQKHK